MIIKTSELIEESKSQWKPLIQKVSAACEWDYYECQEFIRELLIDCNFHTESKKVYNFMSKNKIFNETKIGENKMRIKMSELKSMIGEVLKEETEYQEFFKATLEKFGASSPADLDDKKKKEFFDYIDKNWKSKNESGVDEELEPVSQAAGEPEYNPTKRLKAKKRDQILASEAMENRIRKIVREELRFVMFDEVPGTTSRKVAKKRINMTGNTKDMV